MKVDLITSGCRHKKSVRPLATPGWGERGFRRKLSPRGRKWGEGGGGVSGRQTAAGGEGGGGLNKHSRV